MFLFNTTKRFGKILGVAVLGSAGLLGATNANAAGFRLVVTAPPIIVQQPVYQAPAYQTPVYAAPVAVAPACPAPVIVQQPICAPTPVVVYTQPEHRGWFDWFHHDDHRNDHRDDHRFDRDDHRDFRR